MKKKAEAKVDKESVSTAMATLKLEEDRKKRIERAGQKIAAILEVEGCALDVFVVIRKGSVEPQIQIVSTR